MLAGVRSYILLFFFLAFIVSYVSLSPVVMAQVNGVPASVTSPGFGGNANPAPGVRASVTSLGPNGFGNAAPGFGNCCANFFLPQNNPPLWLGHHRHDGRNGKDRGMDRSNFLVGVPEPVYVPYAVPYDGSAEDESDADAVVRDPRNALPPMKRAANREAPPKAEDSAKLMVEDEPRPVAAQPSTVLIFKDGHQSDVVNYAIVGDTLFDFGSGRTKKILLADIDLPATRKANDDRGVDFRTPSHTAGQ